MATDKNSLKDESLQRAAETGTLDLSNAGITVVPYEIVQLSSLRELLLHGNQLTSLPEWLGNLTALTELDLEDNQLTSLPESLGNLTALTELHLGRNQLTSLPESLGNLTALTELHLEDNQLTSLPESLGNLTDLTLLHLRSNNLTDLPESLGNLTALSVFHLGGNQLTSLPEWFGNLAALTELQIWDNKLSSLPESLGNLTALTFLNVRRTKLTNLPEWLGNLTALTRLYLDGINLAEVPEWLGNLTALKELHLERNQLASVPESLGKLTALTELDLDRNQLASVPESLGNLTALTQLHLEDNQLASVPGSLGNLTALTDLYIAGNHLVDVPESLGKLTALTELYLEDNQLASLPESLGNLTALSALDLSANPLRSPLLEIAEEGVVAVKTYLNQLIDQSAELWTSKLLVVGEGAVGKTSLVKALNGQHYDPEEPTTHGIRITEINLAHPGRSDVNMQLSSWDFGGQDIYHATHQFFLSDRSLFLLLWNARQGWEQAKLLYWLDIIKARAPHAKVILVATHGEGRPIDLPLTDLKGSYPQVIDSAGVDNRTGEGIDELRQKMASAAANLPLMGSHWPTSWVRGVETITTTDLYSRLRGVGVTNASHQAYLLRALHLLGDILYFDEDEELRDIIILRPQWMNGYISKVLDSPEVAAKRGLLMRSHERDLWCDLEPGLRDRFLLMMEKFDLSYRITDDSTAASLVVERLPWDNPPYQELWNQSLIEPGAHEIRLRYQLNTLPPGVPTWFIAREHRFSMGIHWRSGALLRYSGDNRILGLIRANSQKKTVDLAVRGPVPHLFFSVLQDGLESTLGRYQGLEITRLVPCSCDQGRGTQPGQPCAHLYQYGPLLRRMELGVTDVECELSFSRISVTELLFGIAPTTTDLLLDRLDTIDQKLSNFRAETAWAHREFLKALRRQQARHEAVCPSVFTLIPSAGRFRTPGVNRLELHLYCEQPGAFHALPDPPYIIKEAAPWLSAVGPYLLTLITILKHTAPLAGPVLGLTSEHLAKQLEYETGLMKELVSQLSADIPDRSTGELQANDPQRHAELDVDYRVLHALLCQLDPAERWAGLSRIDTPEDQVLWLCRDHARLYSE